MVNIKLVVTTACQESLQQPWKHDYPVSTVMPPPFTTNLVYHGQGTRPPFSKSADFRLDSRGWRELRTANTLQYTSGSARCGSGHECLSPGDM